jgi:GT2 family glycosyltransferase
MDRMDRIDVQDEASCSSRPSLFPSVCVIVPSRNRREDLRRCLAGVLRQDPPPTEVIVVDDASDDGTAEMVRSEFPAATLSRSDTPIGAAAARNMAIARTSADYVWFLDSDSEPTSPDCLARLVAAIEGDATVGSVGAEICRADDGSLFVRVKHIRINGETATEDVPLDPHLRRDTDYLPTCNLLMRRALLADLGGFDPTYVVLSEDKELGWRIARRGLRNVLVGAAPVLHHVSREGRSGDLYRKLRNTTRFAVINLPWWRVALLPWLDLACLVSKGKFRALQTGGVNVTKHFAGGAGRLITRRKTPTVLKLLVVAPRYLACLLAAYAWNLYHIVGSLRRRRRRRRRRRLNSG